MAGGVALLVASSLAIGLAALRVTRAEMRRTFETRMEFLAEAAAQRLARNLHRTSADEEIARAVAAPVRTDGVLFCGCFDGAGRLAAFYGVPAFDATVSARLAELGPAAATALELRTSRGDRVRMRTAPVVARGAEGADRTVGTLLLGYTLAPVHAQFAPVARQVGAIVLLVGALAAIAAWLLARSLVEPIHELVAGTQRLARGDFLHRVAVRSRDELAQLAASFNAMTAQLAASRERLARHQEALEIAVLDRTRELRRVCAELQVLDKMKDGFLSCISHELRTPITSIRAFAEILHVDAAVEPATRQEFAGIILKESDHLSHLVGDVLDLVTIESGDMRFRFARHDPAEVARAAVRQAEPQAREKGIAVEVACAPDLPAVRWDGAKITRLLLELLDNSVRFSPPDARVVLTVARAGDRIRLEVRDDGPGIAPEHLESVFEPFRQSGEVLTGKPSGQGLGLPICRRIALRHDGTIHATPSPRGAHLVVELPLDPEAVAIEHAVTA